MVSKGAVPNPAAKGAWQASLGGTRRAKATCSAFQTAKTRHHSLLFQTSRMPHSSHFILICLQVLQRSEGGQGL